MAELVCVGCGPGDPELLTVKAVNAINAADTIMCPASNEDRPSIVLSIVSDIIDKIEKPRNCATDISNDKGQRCA